MEQKKIQTTVPLSALLEERRRHKITKKLLAELRDQIKDSGYALTMEGQLEQASNTNKKLYENIKGNKFNDNLDSKKEDIVEYIREWNLTNNRG